MEQKNKQFGSYLYEVVCNNVLSEPFRSAVTVRAVSHLLVKAILLYGDVKKG